MNADYTIETDHDLLGLWRAFQGAERDAREQRQRIEMVLQQRMQERGAMAIPHEALDVKLDRGTPSLDPSVIIQAHELLPPEVVAEAYTPEHEETIVVAARWDQRRVNTWSKYGADVAALVERAKVYGDAKLRITPKKGA